MHSWKQGTCRSFKVLEPCHSFPHFTVLYSLLSLPGITVITYTVCSEIESLSSAVHATGMLFTVQFTFSSEHTGNFSFADEHLNNLGFVN